ncbi:MAG: hypothetical protein GY862_38670 [Gammaproteobacteria bacterium]|nr:hypothetical protein [Gammaproteobacteria bacterium]
MMKRAMSVIVFLVMAICFSSAYAGGKILYIDSYHEGYPWSDDIAKGVKSVLDGKDVELKIFRMDTKRNTKKNFMRKAAMKAKMLIESFKPDVVIASDDNASQYLIKPFFRDASLPFVFCGINWDASMYGYPYKNATGMVEVASIPELLAYLKRFAKGDKLVYLAADVKTARKEGLYYKKIFHLELDEKYVKDFSSWVAAYTELQNKYDLLIVGNKAGIKDWNESEAEQIVKTETKIPTGAIYDFMAKYALIGYAKVAEEQGEWAAKTALDVLNGTGIDSIAITTNKKGYIFVNMGIAKAMGITIPDDVVKSANKIIE